jgi:hypothetical protein
MKLEFNMQQSQQSQKENDDEKKDNLAACRSEAIEQG